MFNSNKVLFIDGPYCIFSAFFSAKKKLLKNNPELAKTEDWSRCEKFTKIFYKRIKNLIYQMSKKFEVRRSNIYFVRDCPRETIWRRDYYQKYKENRKTTTRHNKKTHSLGNLFKWIYGELPEMAKKLDFKIIKINSAEAEDVISVIVKEIRRESIESKIYIIAADSDYYQILDDNIYMYNLFFKRLDIKLKETPLELLTTKILKGDDTDNVRGVLSRGKKKDTKNIFSSHININKFLLNRRLIDFKCIPMKIKENILDEYRHLNSIQVSA